MENHNFLKLLYWVFLLGCQSAYGALSETDDPFPGQEWAVACKSLPIHSGASGFSDVSGKLEFGAVVLVNNLSQKYALPDSQQTSTDNESGTSAPASRSAWAEVSSGAHSGFVPVRCLVNKRLSTGPYENPADLFKKPVSMTVVSDRGFSKKEKGDQVAMRGMSKGGAVQECDDAVVSSRGFSKKEKGDQVAMRGMSKSAEVICIKEDFAGLAQAIEQSPFVDNPQQFDLEFRKVGALGEFKK
jgi:hypothetical protein